MWKGFLPLVAETWREDRATGFRARNTPLGVVCGNRLDQIPVWILRVDTIALSFVRPMKPRSADLSMKMGLRVKPDQPSLVVVVIVTQRNDCCLCAIFSQSGDCEHVYGEVLYYRIRWRCPREMLWHLLEDLAITFENDGGCA